MTFTRQIIAGLILGVFAGLFLGDLAAPLSVAGEAFIGLLQMTVLPYIVVSLISNIGGISWAERRNLLKAGISVLAVLMLMGVVVLTLIPIAFPPWDAASFFSSSLIAPARVFDFVELYVPANPFASLANNIVPAVVLFSILLGVGVSGLPGNRGLLRALDVLADALIVINKLVIKLTPIGVFAIAAGTAGTISLEQVDRLQAYLITYSVITLALSFVVLPLLVTAVTPFRYRDLLSIPKDTLLTIFAAGKIIIVLPQLADNIRELFRRYGLDDEEVDHGAAILLPLAYPFPNLGTFIILMFIPFSAWYLGNDLDLADQAMFQASAFLSSFVAPVVGIPFLLDLMQIPSDMMELFIMSTVYTDRIRVVLGAMHLLSLAIVAIAISRGLFRVDTRRLLFALLVSFAVIFGSLLATRGYLSKAVEGEYVGGEALIAMNWMDRPVPSRQWDRELPPVEPTVMADGRLATIERRRTLRVGHLPESLPFAFRNHQGVVVGFDIEMANHLAADLGVELELVRVQYDDISRLFQTGQIDIVMSGLGMTPTRVRKWSYGTSPLDLTMGMLVPDHQRKRFADADGVRAMPGLKLGLVQDDRAFERRVDKALPLAEIERIPSPREFLRGNRPDLDGVIYSAEGGSAWTLIYPNYSIVVPQGSKVHVPLGYPMPRGDKDWTNFVSNWVELEKKNGSVGQLFNHWIRGGGAESKEPRWSIIRDVLHWVD